MRVNARHGKTRPIEARDNVTAILAHMIELTEETLALNRVSNARIFIRLFAVKRHQNDRRSSRFQNAMQFAQRLLIVRHVFEHMTAQQKVY